VCGGSWLKNAEAVRVVARFYYQPQRAYPYLGFRCAAAQP